MLSARATAAIGWIGGLTALAGLALTGAGAWIPLKARLAQHLVDSAWERTLAGERRVRPWPWADTWPVARLVAPRQGATVFVLAGATGSSLAFGPGHWSGTALPGGPGHSVVAGHRDTHFRFLRELEPGDPLHVTRADGTSVSYAVESIRVVHETSSAPMIPLGDRSLVLLTCFPFDGIVPGGPERIFALAVGVDCAAPCGPSPYAGAPCPSPSAASKTCPTEPPADSGSPTRPAPTATLASGRSWSGDGGTR